MANETESVSNEEVPPPSATPPMLSLLEQLKLKRHDLQPTTTKLIRIDGSVSYFDNLNQGLDKISRAAPPPPPSSVKKGESPYSYGFVVDTKPDLTHGQVLPWLFISSQDVPQELSIVEELQISHILSLLPGFQLNSPVQSRIKEQLVLELYDEEIFSTEDNSSTMTVISQAIDFVHGAKNSDATHKVLIHCNAGLSRAPTIAILYLMRKENYRFEDAWKQVRSVRPHAQPNRGFLNYILSRR